MRIVKITPSTIVDISEGKLKIIREGPIDREAIEKAVYQE